MNANISTVESLGKRILSFIDNIQYNSEHIYNIKFETNQNITEYTYRFSPFLNIYHNDCITSQMSSKFFGDFCNGIICFRNPNELTFSDKDLVIAIPDFSDFDEELYFQYSTMYDNQVLNNLLFFSYFKSYSTVFFKLDMRLLHRIERDLYNDL